MKIYNIDKAKQRIVSCYNCGSKLLILQVAKEYLNVMSPHLITYCPICGTEVYAIDDLENKIMNFEYRLMCEEDKKCQKPN